MTPIDLRGLGEVSDYLLVLRFGRAVGRADAIGALAQEIERLGDDVLSAPGVAEFLEQMQAVASTVKIQVDMLSDEIEKRQVVEEDDESDVEPLNS